MQRFYFDRVGPNGTDRDDIGTLFRDIDAAYLDAYQAALEVSVEMLRVRQNPVGGRLEVRDEHQVVIEIPFSEVLRPGPGAPRTVDDRARQQVRNALARSEELKADIASALATTKTSIEFAQAQLGRDQGLWSSSSGKS